MVCRQCRGIEEFFDQHEAARELKKYQKRGPAKTTQMLIDAIKASGVEGKTLLDIGGGVGAIQHELLEAGADRCTSIEASTAYLHAAKGEAKRRGHGDRIVQRHGDFVDIAPEIDQVDMVTLDRVICCYHDVETLVGLSARRAKGTYGLVYPRDHWALRIAFRLLNTIFWLRRSSFRIFVHPTTAVDAVVRRAGFERRFDQKTMVWRVVVYTR